MTLLDGESWICPQQNSKPSAWLIFDRSHRLALESTHLPDTPHGDLISRMLIASARLHNLTRVIREAKINHHAGLGHPRAVWR
jgi:PIN domain nuclease of toxin-antitoxin system